MQNRVSLTLQEGRDKQTQAVLPNTPRHLIKFNHILPIRGGAKDVLPHLFLGFDMQYVDNRKTMTGKTAPSFTVANATLYSLHFEHWELTASVYNLLDKKYGDVGSTEHKQDLIEQDGRTYKVRAAYSF